MTIKGHRMISLQDFMDKILPRLEYNRDALLADFQDAVTTGRDFVVVYRDYEVKVAVSEVETYLKENWQIDSQNPGIPDPIDVLLPPAASSQAETPEEREIAAKHPKPKPELPKFKPVKRPPAAPPEEDVI